MAGADNISTLSSTAFDALKKNMANSKALKLIHSDAQKDSKVIAERQRDRSKIINNTNTAGDAFDSMMSSYSSSLNDDTVEEDRKMDNDIQSRMSKLTEMVNKQKSQYLSQGLNNNTSDSVITSSKLPKEILESFKKNSIDTEMLNPNRKMIQENKSAISETLGENNGSIDYSLIKSIIESAVKKYAVALNKKIIAEGKESKSNNLSELKAMKIGKQFSFITENGDIYTAKLTYKGNIKSKK